MLLHENPKKSQTALIILNLHHGEGMQKSKMSHSSLQTSWNHGRQLVEEECEFIKPILRELEHMGINMLLPSGTLLFDLPDDPEDIDESLEDPPNALDMNFRSTGDTEDADL